MAEAQANDPDHAEIVAAQPPGKPAPPKVSQWSTEVDLLATAVDRIAELIVLVQQVASRKKAKPAPLVPRPVTEIDRARERAKDRQHESMVDDVKQAQARGAARRAGTNTS